MNQKPSHHYFPIHRCSIETPYTDLLSEVRGQVRGIQLYLSQFGHHHSLPRPLLSTYTEASLERRELPPRSLNKTSPMSKACDNVERPPRLAASKQRLRTDLSKYFRQRLRQTPSRNAVCDTHQTNTISYSSPRSHPCPKVLTQRSDSPPQSPSTVGQSTDQEAKPKEQAGSLP